MNAQTQTRTPSRNARHSSEGWNPVVETTHSRFAGMVLLGQAGLEQAAEEARSCPAKAGIQWFRQAIPAARE